MIEILQLSDRLSVGDSSGLGLIVFVIVIVVIVGVFTLVKNFTNPQ